MVLLFTNLTSLASSRRSERDSISVRFCLLASKQSLFGNPVESSSSYITDMDQQKWHPLTTDVTTAIENVFGKSTNLRTWSAFALSDFRSINSAYYFCGISLAQHLAIEQSNSNSY